MSTWNEFKGKIIERRDSFRTDHRIAHEFALRFIAHFRHKIEAQPSYMARMSGQMVQLPYVYDLKINEGGVAQVIEDSTHSMDFLHLSSGWWDLAFAVKIGDSFPAQSGELVVVRFQFVFDGNEALIALPTPLKSPKVDILAEDTWHLLSDAVITAIYSLIQNPIAGRQKPNPGMGLASFAF
ncbi:hypothetical protein [Labrys monachus]|uniref:Uncharacterized protein n=1 Tax=Labrys monachus TaxID=217067 RepID=A0ABU0FDF7_9HYPH|nr:hypothetical protein [Labrys monachus]MDQ0392636.1 hypothetical protein [Labrys monachus]